ncbi:DUF4129 domain-containing protein [Sedimenticola sp.]|uniref:DUF4129 domain-containing protein n=1 Tax=Sedimenticola sp. TaxID=1940285 RepID=UPI003D118014
MELDKIAVTVRPRTPWEAIDLGFTMARAWFVPLWLLWLTLALPIYLLSALFLSEQPIWVIVIVWWCKPAYEPLLLFWLSRALFADKLGLAGTLKQAKKVIPGQLLANLTWRRFNPNRSFNMPVTVLEKLKGKARKKRLAVLGRGQQAGTWLTIAGMHFEIILEVSFVFLIVIMLPEELRWLDLDNFLFNPGRLEQWLQHLGDLLAMSLIAPFYVAAGFALYLTRRTELEAWDIEIAFRRLINRKQARWSGLSAAALLLLFCGGLLSGGYTADATAAELDVREAKTTIQQVLDDPAFGKHKQVTYWKFIGADDQPDAHPEDEHWLVKWIVQLMEGFAQGFAAFGKGVLLMVAGVLLAWLLYKAWANRAFLVIGSLSSARQNRKPKPATLFGLKLESHSLPDDIAGACRQLLQQGEIRQALGLLYRGVLVALLQHERLAIPDSATEGECVERVLAVCPADQGAFFVRLTRLWVAAAYGHRLPDAQLVVGLCGEWEQLFGGVSGHVE